MQSLISTFYNNTRKFNESLCLYILLIVVVNSIKQGAWQPSLNISTVLTSICLLLSEPNPDDGLMHDAVS